MDKPTQPPPKPAPPPKSIWGVSIPDIHTLSSQLSRIESLLERIAKCLEEPEAL